jgi:hypothetical protein
MRYVVMLIGLAIIMIGVVLIGIVANLSFQNEIQSDTCFTLSLLIFIAGVIVSIFAAIGEKIVAQTTITLSRKLCTD